MLLVKINQQDAKIRMATTDPLLYLHIADPKVEISSEPLQLEIHQPAAEVIIHNYPSDYSRGIKNFMDFERDNARKAMENAYEAVGKIASDGARLAKIENKGTLAQLAKEAMNPKTVEINVGSVAEPTIQVTMHEAAIKVIPGRQNIGLKPGSVTGDLRQGSVHVTMVQYPQIHYRVIDSSVDIQT